MFRDEAWDIVILVLVLGIVLPISLNLTLPILKESKELVYDEIYGKTAVSMQGDQSSDHDSFDGGYTYEQIVTLLSKQSYFMPSPRILNIGGEMLSVAADSVNPNVPGSADAPGSEYTDTATIYIPDNLNTMITVKDAVNKWCNAYTNRYGKDGYKLKFTCKYSTGEVEGAADDYYSLFVLGTVDGKQTEFKCLSNGRVETIDNKTCIIEYFD